MEGLSSSRSIAQVKGKSADKAAGERACWEDEVEEGEELMVGREREVLVLM